MRLTFPLACTVSVICFVVLCGGVLCEGIILEPVKPGGSVGLAVIAGAELTAEQYLDIGNRQWRSLYWFMLDGVC